MTTWAASFVSAARRALASAADPQRAPAMASYMQDQFRFYGVGAPLRRTAVRDATRDLGPPPDASQLIAMADACWEAEERELQYTAVDGARRWVRLLDSSHLGAVDRLIVTKSWWDTVDLLATRVVGPLVRSDPELVQAMDRWIDDPNLWRRRTALLHQLNNGVHTDPDRLFRYCLDRSAETEFFIRKAIGWALREYAKTDPDAVWAFVDRHEDRLSGLSVREATKHRP